LDFTLDEVSGAYLENSLRDLEDAIAVVAADHRAESRSLIFGRIERTHQRRDILARARPHPVPVV